MDRVPWNRSPAFFTQYSCRTYPTGSGDKFNLIVLGPLKNLVAIQFPFVALASWGLLWLYGYLFFAVLEPTVPFNSADGQTIDDARAALTTFIAWYLTNMILIGLMYANGSCDGIVNYVEDYYREPYNEDSVPEDLRDFVDEYKAHAGITAGQQAPPPEWLDSLRVLHGRK